MTPAVVAFGAANILEATGLRSPYPDLWSLPVRVHDPDLADLTALLDGPDRPTWLVVAGASLGTWGVDAHDGRPRGRRALPAGGDRRATGRSTGESPRDSPHPRHDGVRRALLLWSWFVGIPNDPAGVVLWIWLGTIAWDIEAPLRSHLDFWRDWWKPLLLMVVYWLGRGLADEIGIPVALRDADPPRRVAELPVGR